MEKRFQGQGVVIIGATGGLGNAIAQAFVNQGARVLLAGRQAEKLKLAATQFPPETLCHGIDMTDAASIDALVEFARAHFGRVDVVVNAAGIDVRKAFAQHSLADIHHTIDLNFTGALLLTRAFLPLLQQQSSGTIVHIGGFADGRLALPYFTVDVASRAGLATFVESLNRELHGSGIHIMFLSPSPADTTTERAFHPLWRKMRLDIAPASQVADELLDAVAKRKSVHIMGGVATIILAKLNAAFPRLADAVILNHYRRILKQFFAPDDVSPNPSSPKTQSPSMWLGMSLVGLSFVLYGGLLLVPWLALPWENKVGISSILVIAGEIAFWVGGAILGKEIVARYRAWLDPRSWFASKK